MKFKVKYVRTIEKTFEAIVEANSEEEAMEKAEQLDIISEEEIDEEPMTTEIIEVWECEEEEDEEEVFLPHTIHPKESDIEKFVSKVGVQSYLDENFRK